MPTDEVPHDPSVGAGEQTTSNSDDSKSSVKDGLPDDDRAPDLRSPDEDVSDWMSRGAGYYAIRKVPRNTDDWYAEVQLLNTAWYNERSSKFKIGHQPENAQELENEIGLSENERKWKATEKESDNKWDAERAERTQRLSVEAERSRVEAGAETVRGWVVIGIVVALITSPIMAMILSVSPQDYGQLIAPVTGIAGTVIGYWFGNRNQSPTQVFLPSAPRGGAGEAIASLPSEPVTASPPRPRPSVS